MSVVFAKIQMRRGTAAQWAAANPVLAQGELAFETDTGLTKVGDGATAYASLPAYATYDQMLAAKEALDEAALDVAAVEASRTAAAASAATATAKAGEASASAAAALASEQSIVAKVNQAEQARIDAIAYAAVAETKADEIVASAQAAAADASAADADRIAAEAARTGAEAAQAIAQGAAAGALASEVAADLSADLAAGSAAQSLAIYGSVEAQQTAVATAQAQASLAAGFAASAASVAQQDLSGITAQALHRSPNAITSMFIYDTSKDSDGGAWTEKCQHTSWWNETLAGKWLGAVGGEFMARAQGATLGPNVVANPTLDQNATGFSVFSGATIVSEGGRGRLTGSGTQFCGVFADFPDPASLTANVLYEMSFDLYAGTYTGVIGISADGQDPITSYASVQGGFTRYTAYIVPGVFTNGTNGRRLRISFESAHTAGQFVYIDNVSYRRVTAITAQSGDYFQLATDGRFYRLWKNRFSWTEDFTNAAWAKTNGNVTMSGVEGLFIPTANAGLHSIGQARDATTHERTMTVEVKAAGYTKVALVETINTQGQSRVVDLTNGSFIGTAGTGTTVVTPLADGWYRISWYSTGFSQFNSIWAVYPIPDTGVNTNAGIYNQSWTADGVSGIRIRYPQIEYAAAFTSYERKVADQITSEVFRGNKRDFPRLAGIVAEAGNVTIYDLTEPGRPMWMRFAANGHSYCPNPVAAVFGLNGLLAIAGGLNGLLAIVGNATSNAFVNGGFRVTDFIRDRGLKYHSLAGANEGISPFPVSGRNQASTNGWISQGFTVASEVVNSVAMTVLPDAPVDPATGLRVPTIWVNTSGGVSRIAHNGTVSNSTPQGWPDGGAELLIIGKDVVRIAGPDRWYNYCLALPLTSLASATWRTWGPTEMASGASPNFLFGYQLFNKGYTASRYDPNLPLVGLVQANQAARERGLEAVISSQFNTGWMTGNVRRCFLSDTEVGALTAPERITNGTFDTDLTGWTIGGTASSVTVVGGAARHDVSVAAADMRQALSLIAGRTYVLQYSKSVVSGGETVATQVFIETVAGGSTVLFDSHTGSANRRVTFVAPANTLHLTMRVGGGSPVAGASVDFDNVSLREVVVDRSYRAASANITGTLTRAQLASGTSLVGYSGFSAANYLREPFSANLDFGTGEWTANAWVNVPTTLTNAMFPVTGGELVTNGALDSDSGWGEAGGAWAFQNGRAEIAAASGFDSFGRSLSIVAGRSYLVEFDYNVSSGSFTVGYGSPGLNIEAISTVGTGSGRLSIIAPYTGFGAAALQIRQQNGCTGWIDNISVREVSPVTIFDRAAASGPRLRLGVNRSGQLTAEASDGTTTRTVTTTAAYNTAQWLKARVNYTTDGTLAILVNGREVAATRGAPLLTLNNASAVLTIGNSFALDAPFPGSIALLKLGATVPTPEQAAFMYEQEKQLFRAGALCVLPDSGALVDMAYDDATDRWVAMSATNESYWTGLVRNSVQAVPAGSFSRVVAGSGLELAARTGTNPGVDVTIPAYGLREELVRRAEAAARLSRELVAFDFVGGFTANTTNGSAAITNVAGLTYPGSLIGARVSGAGIPANTRIVGVSGTTIYLSAAATATATGVSVSFLDFNLPVAFEARAVLSAGALRREGSTADFTRLYDGFLETIRFAVAPGATAWVQIQATRGTMQ